MRLDPRRENRLSPRSRTPRVTGAAACVAAAALLLTACGQSSDGAASTATEAARVLPQKTTASPSPTADLTEAQQERKRVLDATEVTFVDAATTAVGEVAGGKLVDLDLEGVDDDDRDESPSPTGTGSPTGSPTPTDAASPTATGSPTASPGAEGPVWVAEVAEKDGTVHTVRINAVDGKVIEARLDEDQDDQDKQQTAQRLSQVTQPPEQAAKVATEKKNGTVTSVRLDDNDGNGVIWSVDVVGSDWTRTTFDVDAKDDTIVREETDND